ncbi:MULTISPECIES: hypothetical protein [Bradyrhizobium]|uniref:hypothetical protein n=1 Tax=Bradyrhizobium elkanii TaxID=29448 RepID=UPI0018AD4A40|nr:hypothetical protein [Bradyrhizobium elkanii]
MASKAMSYHLINRNHVRHNHAIAVADIQHRFWLSPALTVPILALSQPMQNILDLYSAAFSGSSCVLLVLSALPFGYGACGASSSRPSAAVFSARFVRKQTTTSKLVTPTPVGPYSDA